MSRFVRPHTDAVNRPAVEVAEAMVEAVADAMDRAGMDLTLANTAAVTHALGKALERVGRERECAVRQGRIARRASWVQEQSLLTAVDTARRLGLTARELETAQELAIITPVDIPPGLRATSEHFTSESWRYYLPGVTLTGIERARIAHETLLTRAEAAVRLGVPSRTFDALRMEHGLAPVARVQNRSVQPNLYRTDAVDRLAAAIAVAARLPPDAGARLGGAVDDRGKRATT